MGLKELLDELDDDLQSMKGQSLFRNLRRIDSPQSDKVTVDGRQYISLCSNNYLGLANHKVLKDASVTAIETYGTSASASRLMSGNMGLHEQLERVTAAFKQTEDVLVFNTGYMANTGIIQALASDTDAIFSDELNHASIIDGCRLSRAKVFIYKHRNTEHLRSLLLDASGYRRRIIITESVFSMDGDIAPLTEINSIAMNYDAVLIVDDAHATGVIGKNGRGSSEHYPHLNPLPEGEENSLPFKGRVRVGMGLFSSESQFITMGTYSKALGSFGAYIAGPAIIKKYLINKARPFIYTTALPPSVLAASIAAINLIQKDNSMLNNLWKNTMLFREKIKRLGFNTMNSETPIIPILIGSAEYTIKFSERLFQEGIFASAIRPPTVPDGSCRIRTTITAGHSIEDIEYCIGVFEKVGKELRAI
ncbi:MAG: 8-amino-7-oxononanoate synthase [Nitrospirae bacterium]|nr:8-amino-7-oxononanoate synthase [Nitrospirota bacterium]